MSGIRVIFTGVRQVALEPQPRPSPGPREVCVRTEYTLVSPGTELALYEGTHAGLADPEIAFAKYPHGPGYTAIGRVEACGAEVTGLKPGEQVFFLGRHESWSCWAPQDALWLQVPEGLTIEQVLLGRLLQIASTCWWCLRARPKRVIVIGAGLVGVLAAQLLQARGVPEVVIQDVNPARLRLASSSGVRLCALGTGGDLGPARGLLRGEPDAIVEATGVPAMVTASLDAVRRRGDVILLGSPRGSLSIDLYKQIHRKGVALIGAHEAMLPDRAKPPEPSREELLRQAFEWLRTGAVSVGGLVTDVVRPEEMPDTYKRISRDKNNVLGVIVNWTANEGST